MVNVVDGYKEGIEKSRRKDTLVELARDFFKGNNIDASRGSPITIRKSTAGQEVVIYPGGFSVLIDVNDRSYFETALKFAEAAENRGFKEITLTTNYER